MLQRFLFCLLLGALLPALAVAMPPDQPPAGVILDVSAQRFTAAERNLIRAHLLRQPEFEPARPAPQLPPGLQKKVARGKTLPPGWQKKLAAGRMLDYQLYRSGRPLPEELLLRLPGPYGTEIIVVDDQVIRLQLSTRRIVDFFNLLQR